MTDFGHGLLSNEIINEISKSKKFLAINAQTNSANRGYNLITKYKNADYICIDEPEFRLAMHDKNTSLKNFYSIQKIFLIQKYLLLQLERMDV